MMEVDAGIERERGWTESLTQREKDTEMERHPKLKFSFPFFVSLSLLYLQLYRFSHLFAARKQIKTIETLQVRE